MQLTFIFFLRPSNKISYKALFLLVLYSFIVVPAVLWHGHTHEQVKMVYEKSTACEKSIYFGEECGHESLVSEKAEKCTICDFQVSLHKETVKFFFEFTKKYYSQYFKETTSQYSFSSIWFDANRGPPADQLF